MTEEYYESISKQFEFMNKTMLRIEAALKEEVKEVKGKLDNLPCHRHDLEIQEVQINIKNSKKWLSFAVLKSIAPTLKSITAILTAISATCAAAYAYFK